MANRGETKMVTIPRMQKREAQNIQTAFLATLWLDVSRAILYSVQIGKTAVIEVVLQLDWQQ